MSTTEPMRARNADECRALGWLPGTRLAGDEGFGETVVEITALGEHEILAKTIIRRGVPEGDHHESTWCLDARDWRVVRAAEPRPDVAERVRAAVGGVLWNASNYPERVQARMLGQDTAPLRDKVTDAVLAALPGPDAYQALLTQLHEVKTREAALRAGIERAVRDGSMDNLSRHFLRALLDGEGGR